VGVRTGGGNRNNCSNFVTECPVKRPISRVWMSEDNIEMDLLKIRRWEVDLTGSS